MTGRDFPSGASRDTDVGKLDFEGFLSARALRAYAEYMDEHRAYEGGNRSSDNWQRGIPQAAYMSSMWRHFYDVWALWRGEPSLDGADLERALCALAFNVFGMLHEVTRPPATPETPLDTSTCVLCHAFLSNHVDGNCPTAKVTTRALGYVGPEMPLPRCKSSIDDYLAEGQHAYAERQTVVCQWAAGHQRSHQGVALGGEDVMWSSATGSWVRVK